MSLPEDQARAGPGWAAAPWWTSGFRPFYLLGALYAPLLALGGVGALVGVVDLHAVAGFVAWHGHEMLFGFASAIVVGTLLTALPSWAGLPEVQGRALAALVAAWSLGRLGFWLAPWSPAPLVALLDLLLGPTVLVLLAPPLWRHRNRLYRLLPPILAALALANAGYHLALYFGEPLLALRALRGAAWALVLLFTLMGGALTPIFTGNSLRALGRGEQARFVMPLEVLAFALLLALALADLAGAPPLLSGALAAAGAAVQGVRVARWRGWRVADQPLLPAMHLGFAWLLLALVLKAAADLGAGVPEPAWLHVFTVGALGMMMLGLMTRVSLRHTGRPLAAPPLMRAAAVALCAATALRLAVVLQPQVWAWGAGLAATLWALAFVAYALQFAPALLTPSLPRR